MDDDERDRERDEEGERQCMECEAYITRGFFCGACRVRREEEEAR